jgi:signal peptidase
MEEKTKKVIKKTLKISSYVLLGIVIFTVIFALIANIFAGEDKKASFFGLKSYIVLSDSMSATDFSAGDLIVTSVIDTDGMSSQERNAYIESKIKVGDIITFHYDINEDGKIDEMVTHKVRYIGPLVDEDGDSVGRGIVTYSTTTGQDDRPIDYSQVIGKYSFSVPKVGYVIEFFQSTAGFFIFIFTPLAVMVILMSISTVSLIKQAVREKKESVELAKQEYAQGAMEESERLRAELEALKAQMAQQQTQETQTEQPSTEE